MAISNIGELLKKMSPELSGGKYYFASLESPQLMSLANYLDYVLCICKEKEGISVVFSSEAKDGIAQLTSSQLLGPFALITLNVDSDLFAAGFLAKITSALAKESISANAISAYHHDCLLVPYEKRGSAIASLNRLSRG